MIMEFLQMWDEIMISEEAESGKKVTSLIKVPTQVYSSLTVCISSGCKSDPHTHVCVLFLQGSLVIDVYSHQTL